MWGFLREWLSSFGMAPWRLRGDQSMFRAALGWLGAVSVIFGLVSGRFVFAVAPIALLVLAAGNVAFAYRALERAAVLDLDDPYERPRRSHRFVPYWVPTALSLFALAELVDAVRRGQTWVAPALLLRVDASLLHAHEVRLLEASRALVLLGQGEEVKAAQKAIAALPTGSEDLDLKLGRLVLENAWQSPLRLFKIDDAWRLAGVGLDGASNLSCLRRLIGLRLSQAEIEDASLSRDELAVLAIEARAIGDEKLARELDVASRDMRSYRG